jgi:hypothetical protein
VGATIADGLMTLTRTQQKQTVYTLAGASDGPRTIVLEQPRIDGFTLLPSTDYQLIETTEKSYRLEREIPANGSATVTVTLAKKLGEVVILTSTSTDQLVTYATSAGLSAEVRAALSKVVDRRAQLAAKEAVLSQKTAERSRIVEDQARLRENLKAVPAGSDLAKRYLKRMNDQEERLLALEGEIAAAQAEVGVARAALAAEIKALHIT